MMITEDLNFEIQEYAKSKYPEESCGLIVKEFDELTFVECENTAKDKINHFAIDNSVMIKHSQYLFSIFHSHVESSTPAVTLSDINTCEAWNVPGSIVFLSHLDNKLCSDVVLYGKDIIYNTLKGRRYYYNVFDCFTLIRDFYFTTFNIDLPLVYSDYGWWETTERADSLYLTQFERLGMEEFDITTELQIGDILAMKLGRSKCINHGAIYTGNGRVIHHLEGKLSVEENLGKYASRIERGMRRAKANNTTRDIGRKISKKLIISC